MGFALGYVLGRGDNSGSLLGLIVCIILAIICTYLFIRFVIWLDVNDYIETFLYNLYFSYIGLQGR